MTTMLKRIKASTLLDWDVRLLTNQYDFVDKTAWGAKNRKI
jgi:hypothetical protein